LNNLTSNTQYKVMVRSQCSTNGATLSPWSTPVFFTTPGAANCIAPTSLTATPTSGTSATVSWTAVPGAAGYQLRYKANGALNWNPVVIVSGGTTSMYNLTSLQPNTLYKYQVRTKCSLNPLTWSNYSSVQTFVTPLRLGESETVAAIELYPNPATAVFNVNVRSTHACEATIEVMGVEGRVLASVQRALQAGDNATAVNASGLSAGLYVVRVTVDGVDRYRKLVLQ
jgi:hypothetical protein